VVCGCLVYRSTLFRIPISFASLVRCVECLHPGSVLHAHRHGEEPRHRQQTAAQQIAQGRQVGYGRVIRIDLPFPHRVHNNVGNIQQQHHLKRSQHISNCVLGNNFNYTICLILFVFGYRSGRSF